MKNLESNEAGYVLLRRKPVMGHLPKTVKAAASVRLGSIYVNRQPLKAFTGEEEKKFLTGVLDVDPSHPDWPRHSKRFWSELSVKVPFEGVRLNIGVDEEGNPHDLIDYIKYRFALVHPHVGTEGAIPGGKHRFYLVDPKKDLINKNKKIQMRKDADKEFIKLVEKEEKMDWVLRMLSKSNPDRLSKIQKENELFDIKEKQPAKFVKITTDKNLALKAELERMTEWGVIRRIGNQVIYIDEVIGETLEDAVVYLKNKKNSGTLTILRAKLQEASRDTRIMK